MKQSFVYFLQLEDQQLEFGSRILDRCDDGQKGPGGRLVFRFYGHRRTKSVRKTLIGEAPLSLVTSVAGEVNMPS